MIARWAAVALLGISPVYVELGAQHSEPVSLRANQPHRSTAIDSQTANSRPLGFAFADTVVETKQRVMPFLLGGAVLGGIIGGVMAASYSFCSGDPQPGVYCTSTDPATGVVIGAAVGIAAGWLVWAVTNSNKK
jgi:hypothetical protein